MPNVLLDFEDLHAGDIVNGQYSADGVTITSIKSSGSIDTKNPPMVFDTANPTGGDNDLATSNMGNVLIFSEDGDSSDPDDEACGGIFNFDFEDPSEVINFRVLDIDHGEFGKVRLYDEHDNLIKTVHIPSTGDGNQATVDINTDGVARMEVELSGSGAIDGICFCTPEPEPETDGIVSGDNDDNLINVAYDGDPDGDFIDNNDAILPGEVGDDDIVDALGGDDTVLAGDGDDEVYAGSGDDTVKGGSGDDIIYGDSNYNAPTPGSEANLLINGNLETQQADNTFSQSETITGWKSESGLIEKWGTGFGNEFSKDGGNFVELDSERGLDGIYQDVRTVDDATYTLTFDLMQRVEGSDDQIEVYFGGVLIDTVTPGDEWTTYTYELTGSGADRLEFREVKSDNNTYGPLIDTISLVGEVPEALEGGNDKLLGGSGNDTIYGEGGDDTLKGQAGDDTLEGGTGADKIYGGNDRDTIIGGNDGDTVDGGTGGDDYDILDLTGEGPFRVVDETVDADGDSTSGIIEFLDDDDNVTGTMSFTEIEKIVGDRVNTGPTANDDTADVDEDESVVIDVLANDTDPEGDDLTVTDATSPDGEVTINPDGTITFTPDENFNGDTTITYEIEDEAGNTSTGTVEITVAPINDAPDAVNDVATTPEDEPVTIDVLANDTDVDGDTLTITGATVPESQGTVEIVDNELLFTPAENFNGLATISYAIEDGNGGTDTAIAEVTVTPVNDAPVAVDDVASTEEDTSVVIDLIANDFDVDGDDLTIGTVSVPSDQGTVVDNGDGTVTFTPAPNYTGPASISYSVVDGNGGEDVGAATVNVFVEGVNDGPDAVDDTATTDEDTPVTIDVLANDSDIEDDPLTITGAKVPVEQGSVEIVDNELVFTPAPDFNGEATITYSITDGNGGTDTAEVAVTVAPVNDDPVAVDDLETTDEDEPITIDLISNDTDVDGDPLSVGSVSVPSEQGTVVDNGDGTVTFTPAPNFNGPATITYTVVDGQGGEDEGQAVVSVGAINDGPVAEDDNDTTPEDTPITVDLLANDTDADGDTLSLITASVPEQQGTLVDNGDGTVTFTPAPDFNGTATISYEISDGNGGTDTAEHVIEVTPVNDGPDAIDDAANGDVVTPTVIDVIGNDTDPDGDELRVLSFTQPAEGGTVTDNGDGTLTFTPDGTVDGEITFEYTITDDNGGTDTATVTLFLRDGIVEGTAGDDIIDVNYTGDPEGDVIDGGDAILPGEGPQDDIVLAGDGSDTVKAGAGDDEVYGQDGNDDLRGNAGDDYLSGGAGDDALYGGQGDDVLDAGQGEDELFGGAGDDILLGGPGSDLLDGGTGDDELFGGNSADEIIGGDGNDTAYGGDGNDIIDTSGSEPLPDLGYPGLFPADEDPNDDIDFVDGGDGDDTITTGDDADTIIGGLGDDTIDGGIDADTIDGGDGDDRIVGGEGSDTIDGGAGDDTIYAGIDPALGLPDNLDIPDDTDLVPNNGMDVVNGGDGNDTIFGADDDDILNGDAGDDYIDGGIDDDTITGGSGEDTIIGGHGADDMSGGDDADTFIVDNAEDGIGDVIDGNTGGDDNDTLNLTGAGPLRIVNQTVDADGDSTSGTIEFLDGVGGEVIGTLDFSEIENIVPCFTPGTSIATPRGEMLVEDLQVGDKIITRDNGIQEIRWIGAKRMDGRELRQSPHLQPVLIQKGSLGNGLPERDMLVSPNHRMLVNNDRVSLYFEENEVLVSAKHLVDPTEGVQAINSMGTTYIHFMFDNHEVVLSNGAWTESFQPGDLSLKGIGNAQRNEIFELFPELQGEKGREAYASARLTLKKHEARMLFK